MTDMRDRHREVRDVARNNLGTPQAIDWRTKFMKQVFNVERKEVDNDSLPGTQVERTLTHR